MAYRTLIVAATADAAKRIRQQFGPDLPTTVVTHPGDMIGSRRYDLILVTDLYSRWFAFATGKERDMMEDWFDTCVRTTLASPDAKLIYL